VIVACLAWYAETAETLERCALSLAGVCERMVAASGRWYGFPEVPADDRRGQLRALKAGCATAKIELVPVIADGEWPSQVDKRATLMDVACSRGDWLFVIDADEYVAECQLEEFHDALWHSEFDVAQIHGRRVPLKPSSARRPWRRLYRASTRVTVRQAHNGYVTEDGRWLYGDPSAVDLEPCLDLTGLLLLEHDREARSSERKDARRVYNLARRDERLETWEPVLA